LSAKIHKVKEGDTIASIAKRYGFSDWHTIYDHKDNAELRKQRHDPNILFPDDKVVIPEKEKKEDSGVTDQRHTFQFKGKKQWIRIIMKDQNNKPLKNEDYTLEIENVSFKGKTDSNGLLEHEIPQSASRGVLQINRWVLTLLIGHLDPHEEVSGWQARLTNLGYNPGPIDGQTKDDGNERLQLRSAVEEFQRENDLKVDSVVGSKTLEKLKELHGC
jgi:hypothetical protein